MHSWCSAPIPPDLPPLPPLARYIQTDIFPGDAQTPALAGSSRAAVRAFPPNARRNAGYQLYRVQAGHDPSDWKPMAQVGPGVREIRIRGDGEYRVLYLATRPEAVYVLHAFAKKSRHTRSLDLDLARTRLKELLRDPGRD
jgi:phage-related protein